MSQPANDDYSQHLSDDEASYHEDASDNGTATNKPKQQQQLTPTTTTISNIKLPILKKEEYDIWAMEMEHYLEYIDNDVWKDDAKEIWEAIRTRFGGNANSKKMQKAVLKQQFEAFSISSSEGLEKGYDRFQQLLSQLEAHDAEVSTEDANHKFLRSLPPAWSNLAMTMRTKPDVDILSIDDLYNNLMVFEQELTSTSKSSASAQNVAFVSHSKSSTNKVKYGHTGAYSTYTPTFSNNIQEREVPANFADEVIYSLFAKQFEDLDLLHEDLEQIDDIGIEEMDINWQITMIAIRMKKFYKKTGRRVRIDGNKPVWFDKKKLDVSNVKNMEFTSLTGDYTPKPQEEINDSLYVYGKKGPQKPEISDSYDNSTEHSTYQSNDSEGSCRNTSEHSSEFESESISVPNEMSTSKSVITNEKVVSESKEVEPSCATHVKTPRQQMKNQGTSEVKGKNWNKMMERELEEGYSFIKKRCFVCGSLSHLIKDCDYYEKKMAREAEFKKQRVFNTGNRVAKLVWTNANRVNHANHFIPRPLQLNAGRPNVNSVRPNINTGEVNPTHAYYNGSRTSKDIKDPSWSTSIKTRRPKTSSSHWKRLGCHFIFCIRTHVNTGRTKQPVPTCNTNSFSPVRPQGNWGTAFKTSAGYNWRRPRPNSNYNSGSNLVRTDHPLKNMEDRGIFDSRCSGHMTGNKDHLDNFEECKGGSVTFGGSKGYITGKGRIRVGNLDFDSVSFVKELGHFNLFSISQICDKQHKVLFTETECLVVSPDFKMPDENQILLKVPRQHNMYSFDMKTPSLTKDYACLIAKATSDESKLWHRRLGHINFKNLNKLVKSNLVRGLPSKVFRNDHTCVACQKGKQHKASCKAKLERTITVPLHTLHMDLFGPTSVKSINHASYLGYPIDNTFTFWKKHFTPNWKFMVHHILHCISSKSGGWDQFGSKLATALICLSTGRTYNFSKMIFEAMVANVTSQKKFLMYPRFLSMVLEAKPVNTNLYLAYQLTKKIFGNMNRGFAGVYRPLLANMIAGHDENQELETETELHGSSSDFVHTPPTQVETPSPEPDNAPTEHTFDQPSTEHQPLSPRQEPEAPQSQYPSHPHVPEARSLTAEDLLHMVPTLITKVDSLETELKQTKQTMGKAIVKLVKKVKKLENILKRRNVVLTTSEDEEPEDQGRIFKDIDDDPLVSFVTPTKPSGEAQEEEISPTTLEAAKTLSKLCKMIALQFRAATVWGFYARLEANQDSQPPGFDDPDHPKKFIKDVKALYGLNKPLELGGGTKVKDQSPTTLEALKILTKVQKIKSVDQGKRYKRRKSSKEFAGTGLDFEEVKSAFEKVNTGGIRVSVPSPDRGRREGKAQSDRKNSLQASRKTEKNKFFKKKQDLRS
ncbi:putative ribonuclease H-like domain-containing protein [Tanacetum coccineum]